MQKGCQLTLAQADDYLKLGETGTFDLAPGKIHSDLVKINPSSTAPLCEIKYTIAVKKDGQAYDSSFFIVKIIS